MYKYTYSYVYIYIYSMHGTMGQNRAKLLQPSALVPQTYYSAVENLYIFVIVKKWEIDHDSCMIHVYTVRDVLPWHTLEAEIPEVSIDPQSILCYQMGKGAILCWGNDESNLCFERVLMIHHQFISKIIKLYPHHVLSS